MNKPNWGPPPEQGPELFATVTWTDREKPKTFRYWIYHKYHHPTPARLAGTGSKNYERRKNLDDWSQFDPQRPWILFQENSRGGHKMLNAASTPEKLRLWLAPWLMDMKSRSYVKVETGFDLLDQKGVQAIVSPTAAITGLIQRSQNQYNIKELQTAVAEIGEVLDQMVLLEALRDQLKARIERMFT